MVDNRIITEAASVPNKNDVPYALITPEEQNSSEAAFLHNENNAPEVVILQCGENAPEVVPMQNENSAPELVRFPDQPGLECPQQPVYDPPQQYDLADSQASLEPPKRQERLYCGLKRRSFLAVVILAHVLLVAMVAGGIGGALSRRTPSSSSPTPSTPSNTANAVEPKCPDLDGKTLDLNVGQPFNFTCWRDYEYYGAIDVDGQGASDLTACLRQCTDHNKMTPDQECASAVFSQDRSICWLRSTDNSTGLVTSNETGDNDYFVLASIES